MSWPRTRRCDNCNAYDFHRLDGGSLGQVQILQSSPGIITAANRFPPGLSPISFNAVVFTLISPPGIVAAMPTGLSAQVPYWVSPIDSNNFSVASSLANLLSGALVDTTGPQVGIIVCDSVLLGCHEDTPLESQVDLTPRAAKWRSVDPDYWCNQWSAWNPM